MLPGDCTQHADLQLPSRSWSEIAGGQGWGQPAAPHGSQKQYCAPTRQSTEWPSLDKDVATSCNEQLCCFSAFTQQEAAALGTSSLVIQHLVQPIVKNVSCITHWPVQWLNMAGKDWVSSTWPLRYLSCNFFQHPSYEWLGGLILYLPFCVVKTHRLDSSCLPLQACQLFQHQPGIPLPPGVPLTWMLVSMAISSVPPKVTPKPCTIY